MVAGKDVEIESTNDILAILGVKASICCKLDGWTPVVVNISVLSIFCDSDLCKNSQIPFVVTFGVLSNINSSNAGKGGRYSLEWKRSSLNDGISDTFNALNIGKDPIACLRIVGSIRRRDNSITSRFRHNEPFPSSSKLLSDPAMYAILRRSGHLACNSDFKAWHDPSSVKIPSGRSTYFRLGSNETTLARSDLQVSLVIYGSFKYCTTEARFLWSSCRVRYSSRNRAEGVSSGSALLRRKDLRFLLSAKMSSKLQ